MIKQFIPTKNGLDYFSKALSDRVCVFTRGSFGNGVPAAEVDPMELAELISVKGPLTISDQSTEDGTINISTQFSNRIDGEILDPFYLTEVGIYGKLKTTSGQDDPEFGETLLIYGYITEDKADYIQDVLNEFIINFPVNFSEAPNIEIVIDKSMAYPTKKEFGEAQEEIKEIQTTISHKVDGGGSGSALTAVYEMALIDGLQLTVKLPENLGDDATFAYNGGEALPIVGLDGEPISSGAKKGTFINLIYSKSDQCWYMLNSDGSKRNVTLKNVSVPPEAWEASTECEGFPFRAMISCPGITEESIPEVTFSFEDAISGVFAPVALTITDALYIYAKEIPEDTIIIETVELRNAKAMRSPYPGWIDDKDIANNEDMEDFIEETFGEVVEIEENDTIKVPTLDQVKAGLTVVSGMSGRIAALEGMGGVTLLHEGKHEFTVAFENSDGSPASYGHVADDYHFLITAGEKYRIAWDGELYDCTADDNGYIGNKNLLSSAQESTGEPFIIYNVNTGEQGWTYYYTKDTAKTRHSIVVYLVKDGSAGGDGVEIDTTLTKSGAAADAKAVGDALKKIKELPTVAAADNGKILRVVDGAWAAVELPNAENMSF